MKMLLSDVAELAKRTAERHAELVPNGRMTAEWLLSAFQEDVAAHPAVASMWTHYLDVAVAHRARLAFRAANTRRIRAIRQAC